MDFEYKHVATDSKIIIIPAGKIRFAGKHTTQVVDLLSHLFDVFLGFLDKIRIWTQALQFVHIQVTVNKVDQIVSKVGMLQSESNPKSREKPYLSIVYQNLILFINQNSIQIRSYIGNSKKCPA